jgi:hypothetical protein
LPPEAIHPAGFGSAVAATCTAQQGRSWDLHSRLFENQKRLDAASLPVPEVLNSDGRRQRPKTG